MRSLQGLLLAPSREPTSNTTAIIGVLLAKDFAQLRLFVEMDEENCAAGGDHEVEKNGQRPEVEGARRYNAEYAEVHGVSDEAIKTPHHEFFGGVDGRGRSQALD